MGAEQRYFAPLAWVAGGWARNVLLVVDGAGLWSEITPDARPDPGVVTERLPGPVLPGLVNAHSHAFQRAIAGLTERSAGSEDDFWRWRERMYAVALRISPVQLEAVAAFLYGELLAAGYTQVCEFHYLHNAPDGTAYAQPAEMALALVRAAHRTGIGLTLLPTLYMREGFGAATLRDDQRRFASTPESVLRLAQVAQAAGGRVSAGVAIHSLRAVAPGAMRELCAGAPAGRPLHIHISEQVREVQDCQLELGQRPVDWLLANAEVDERWNLVHATHAGTGELAALRQRGAAIVLCPTTEGNLGDGVFDLPAWLGGSGRWSIGSDSHVCRSWTEELRLLEYSQRLALRQRNVAGRASVCESTAAALFEGALEGGSAAAGQPLGGLARGQRADFQLVDTEAASLAGVPQDHLLDALVFSSPALPPAQVYVAGRKVVDQETRGDFAAAMRSLWADARGD